MTMSAEDGLEALQGLLDKVAYLDNVRPAALKYYGGPEGWPAAQALFTQTWERVFDAPIGSYLTPDDEKAVETLKTVVPQIYFPYWSAIEVKYKTYIDYMDSGDPVLKIWAITRLADTPQSQIDAGNFPTLPTTTLRDPDGSEHPVSLITAANDELISTLHSYIRKDAAVSWEIDRVLTPDPVPSEGLVRAPMIPNSPSLKIPRGSFAVTWDPGPISHYGPPSPQARDRAVIAARDHGDEFFFGLPGGGISKLRGGGGGGPGMGSFASNLGGPRDTNTYAHAKRPAKGQNPGPASAKVTKGPNPSTMASASNPPAHRSTDVDRGFVGGGGSTGGGAGHGGQGPTGGVASEGRGGIDKSQERASSNRQTLDKSSEKFHGPGYSTPSITYVDSSSGKSLSTYTVSDKDQPQQGSSTAQAMQQMAEDNQADESTPNPEDDSESSRKQKHGGGGAMPNPEDSGDGGEGPRQRGLRSASTMRIASRNGVATRERDFGSDADSAGLGSIGDRVFDSKLFRFRVPGALGDMASEDQNPNPEDQGATGGGGAPRARTRSSLAGPRSYDAYPDPESTGDGGPRGRYNERPNPEDTAGPRGPNARNRSAIGPWSASRNRMI